MDPIKLIGGCALVFFIAVAFDVIGMILLFIGIFANLRIDGRFFGDFFIYTGSLIIFISLFCWLIWYAGNIPVSEDDGPKKRGSIAKLARKFSERLGQTLRGEDRVKRVEVNDGSQVGSRPHKASRVTWGKSTAYHNKGYDGSLDSPSEEEKKVEETEKEGPWTGFTKAEVQDPHRTPHPFIKY